jgi:hypothetical protein
LDARVSRTSGSFSVVIGGSRFRGACIQFVHDTIVIPIWTSCRFRIFSSRSWFIWACIEGIFDAVSVSILEGTTMAKGILGSGACFVGACVVFVGDAIEVAIGESWFRGGRGCGFGYEAQEGEGAQGGGARGVAGASSDAEGQVQRSCVVADGAHVFQDGLGAEVGVLMQGGSPDLGAEPGTGGGEGDVGGTGSADALAGLFRGEQG